MHRDLDSIPVLAKTGTIVPMYRSGESNDLSLSQPMDIHVWRGNGSFELYEDDGETFAYRDGKYLTTRMTVFEEEGTVRFHLHNPLGDRSLVPGKRDFRILFRDIVEADVTVNGSPANVPADSCVCVSIDGGQETVIELKYCRVLRNPPRSELTAALLTRVQGSNLWKNTNFPTWDHPERTKKLPAYIREALAELDQLIQ